MNLRTVFFALMMGLVCGGTAAEHPNVVIVMTDDQGYPNLSCVGHPLLKTPNIDRLWEGGIRLTDYHVDPTCAPTRSALMTGRYSDRAGVWHTVMGRNLLRRREVTMADVFTGSGYATGIFGKWHLGDVYPYRPEDRGFREVLVHGAGGVGQTPDFWGNDYFDDAYLVNGKMTPFKGFCTDVYFTEAMKFMERSARQGEPFFAYITPNAPHGPFYSPAENVERLKKRGVKLSDPVMNYYGMIENIDDNFGRLQAFLKKQGLADNTILVFTSDNGPVQKEAIATFNAGLRGGKSSYFDGGHRVPWLMRWPAGGLDRGVDISRVTAHIDILPTLIDLCGLTPPKVKFDGQSLRPLLYNPSAPWPARRLVVENQRVVDPLKYRQFSVMSDQWRLTGLGADSPLELFDAQADRGQQQDVAKEQPEAAAEMRAAYEAFWEDVSREHQLVSRMMVGADQQNPVMLTSHDWLGSTLWNQDQICRPRTRDYVMPTGHWAVEVAESGWYQISLRRWPAEADRAICDPYIGTGYDIEKATLEIQGQKMEQAVSSDAREVTFRVKLEKGEARLDALFSGDGQEISAFYAYILREVGDVGPGWQTREGLGLPLAVWPETHGADPSVR